MQTTPLDKLIAEKAVELPADDSWPTSWHLFEQIDVLAVKAAVAAGRPLLLRGEPGTGKTQFARAVATQCEWLLVPIIINGTTELEDLFWRHDAVARLADAQVMETGLSTPQRADVLDYRRYLIPGPLWWAFNWQSANDHLKTWCEGRYHRPRWAGESAPTGVILLIDEIDKADQDLPNGLLEAFGQRGFSNPWVEEGGIFKSDTPLLSVITTNEERELPRAFLRRCLVREIVYPAERDKEEFVRWFTQRARTHFSQQRCDNMVLDKAAELIRRDREVTDPSDVRPGLAEYLDLLRAVCELYPDDKEQQLEGIENLGQFILKKQSQAFNTHS